MRYTEFFKLLRQTPRSWCKTNDGFRCPCELDTHTHDCPLTAVFNTKFKNIFRPINAADPERAGYILGLNTRQINTIIMAADLDGYGVWGLLGRMDADQMSLIQRLKLSWVRYRIRKACGL